MCLSSTHCRLCAALPPCFGRGPLTEAASAPCRLPCMARHPSSGMWPCARLNACLLFGCCPQLRRSPLPLLVRCGQRAMQPGHSAAEWGRRLTSGCHKPLSRPELTATPVLHSARAESLPLSAACQVGGQADIRPCAQHASVAAQGAHAVGCAGTPTLFTSPVWRAQPHRLFDPECRACRRQGSTGTASCFQDKR